MSELMIYFWVDEKSCSIEELLEVIDKAFWINAVNKHKVFKVITSPSMPERIYLSLN